MAQDALPKPWAASKEEKRNYVRRMFAEISPTYDLLNSAMSLRLHHRWRAEAVRGLGLADGGSAADVCCGTGDFARPLRKAVGPGGRIVGLDFCLPMLELAKRKQIPMELALADATALPLRSSSVDAATVGWGLRNVPDLAAALSEIYRVLSPGGKLASVDMAVPKSCAAAFISSVFTNRLIPFLGSLFGRKEAYTYLPASTKEFETPEQLASAMEEAGFKNVRFKRKFFGNICIHWGEK